MKKQTLIQRLIILITTGFITQVVLTMINQIVITRLLGEEGMEIYVLILPSLTLFSTISSVGFSTAIPTLLAKADSHHKKILFVVFIMTLFSSLVISLILFVIARPFATTLLRDERTYLPLISIIPLLFLMSFSTILKTYLQSKHSLTTSSIAILVGQMVRIIASFLLISKMIPLGIVYGVVGVMLGAIIAELASIILLLILFFCYIQQNYSATHHKPANLSSKTFKDVIRVSIPTTGNRLIIAFTQFLEPIIVIQCLFKLGYPSDLSSKLYSAISGYTLPILLMPSFISQALTQSITPYICDAYKTGDVKSIRFYLNTLFKLSFLVSGLYTVLIMLFPIEIMNLMFNTSTGSEYLLFMAPFFLLFFFQTSLTSILQSVDSAKSALWSSFISSMIKISLMLILLPIPRFNIQGLAMAIVVQTIIHTLWQYFLVRKRINYGPHFHGILNGIFILGITYLFGYYLSNNIIFTSRAVLNLITYFLLIALLYLLLLFLSGLFPRYTHSRNTTH